MKEVENIIITNIKHHNDTFSMIDFVKYQLEFDNIRVSTSNLFTSNIEIDYKISHNNVDEDEDDEDVNEDDNENDNDNDNENDNDNDNDNNKNDDEDALNIKIKANIIDSVAVSINDIFESIKNLQTEFKCVQKKIILLKKDYSKVINISNKLEIKKNKQKSKLQTGFTKPRAISSKMCIFLELEPGSKLGRNEVTTRIHNYIVTNDLRDNSDRRIILPNKELREILDYNIDNSVPLSYFNLQSYLKRHFI